MYLAVLTGWTCHSRHGDTLIFWSLVAILSKRWRTYQVSMLCTRFLEWRTQSRPFAQDRLLVHCHHPCYPYHSSYAGLAFSRLYDQTGRTTITVSPIACITT